MNHCWWISLLKLLRFRVQDQNNNLWSNTPGSINEISPLLDGYVNPSEHFSVEQKPPKTSLLARCKLHFGESPSSSRRPLISNINNTSKIIKNTLSDKSVGNFYPESIIRDHLELIQWLKTLKLRPILRGIPISWEHFAVRSADVT
jgi:hypothetical protein